MTRPIADTKLRTLDQERAWAALADVVEGRPIDISMERIVREREAMERALFERLADKPEAPSLPVASRSPWRPWHGLAIAGAAALAVWLASTPAPAAERIEGAVSCHTSAWN